MCQYPVELLAVGRVAGDVVAETIGQVRLLGSNRPFFFRTCLAKRRLSGQNGEMSPFSGQRALSVRRIPRIGAVADDLRGELVNGQLEVALL